jgi:osmotically-inducible protein OsmY
MTPTARFTDTSLKASVVEELDWNPSINSSSIGVAVSDGAVTLSGEVDAYPEKRTAVKAAQHVHGVTAVADEIMVRGSGWGSLNDTDVTRNAREALNRSVDVPDTVKAAVHDHVVTLSGEARQHERLAAVRAVKYLMGVREVHNNVTLRKSKTPAAAEIKAAISRALIRNAHAEGSNLTITCDTAGVVTLEGFVHSWTERSQAEYASWAAPGVTGVDDHLFIHY